MIEASQRAPQVHAVPGARVFAFYAALCPGCRSLLPVRVALVEHFDSGTAGRAPETSVRSCPRARAITLENIVRHTPGTCL